MSRQTYLSMDFDYVKVENGAKVVISLLKQINDEYEKSKKLKFSADTTELKGVKKDLEAIKNAYGDLDKMKAKASNSVPKALPVDDTQKYARAIQGLGMAFVTLKGVSSTFSGFTKLETTMSNLAIASRKSMSEISSMYLDFFDMSSQIPVQANDLARVTDNLVRTGKTYQESIQITRETAKLAVATGEDLESTASTVSKLMTALKINAKDTDQVLNTLHSTAIQTASSMESISGGFKQVAGVLGALSVSSGRSGKDLEEYKQRLLALGAGGIGVMNNLGKSASESTSRK